MAFSKSFVVVIAIQLLLINFAFVVCNAEGLKLGFYRKSCPAAELIVKKRTADHVSRAPSLAAPLLRLQFHDCFVRGCEASVLLNTTSNNQTEKNAFPNRTLRGFHVIDAIKSSLEDKCPGVVSCADILALVARDSVSMIGGPYWKVPLGRRDGTVSMMMEALINLPDPFANITQLKASFASLGLNAKDLVVLSGSHTIGTSHCGPIINRLYNFTGRGDTDPTLDPNYVVHLKNKCKPGGATTVIEMDPGSFKTFDEDYYTSVSKRRGLFRSDAALLDDSETRKYVKVQAKSHGSTFNKDFAKSMVKMGKIGVLTGNSGEIRKHCAFVN